MIPHNNPPLAPASSQNVLPEEWLRRLTRGPTDPDSIHPWRADPASLASCSTVQDVSLGTGHALYARSILPAIASAEHEVILVTCFWSASPTLDALNGTLAKLSDRGLEEGRRIAVRVCFSSLSVLQKLFHPQNLRGRTYGPEEWPSKLGLHDAQRLRGLDLQVKSIFLLPFSVMHPKFVVVDRKLVLVPSCNVSWEAWLEGVVSMTGPAVGQFVQFWQSFWASEGDRGAIAASEHAEREITTIHPSDIDRPNTLSSMRLMLSDVPSIFLPSPHHRNPRFSLPFRRGRRSPPWTPLNTFILSAIDTARKDIYMQTPNLTSAPVLSALASALARGVDVTIVTSKRLMILEQLVTAGTATTRCIKGLKRNHHRLLSKATGSNDDAGALESGSPSAPGRLRVSFYRSHPHCPPDDPTEPVQSHLKLTIIDGQWTVLGSGNMDRASWYTSQELGVAFFSPRLATSVRDEVDRLMQHRKEE